MHIVYIVSQYPTLTETFVAREIEQLARLGCTISILALRPLSTKEKVEGLRIANVEVLRSPINPFAWLRAQLWLLVHSPIAFASLWVDWLRVWTKPTRLHHLLYILLATTWLARELHSRDAIPGHIRAHFLHSEAVSAMWMSRILTVPYSITGHVLSIRYPSSLICRAIRKAAFVVADIRTVYELFLATRGTEDVYLIRNGLNLDDFAVRSTQNGLPDKPLVLAAGSLTEPKGFHVLVEACAQLKAQEPSFHCCIIGEGPERTRLEELVKRRGLEGQVSLTGACTLEQLKAAYYGASIFVMPSVDSPVGSDGLPTVIIESMAIGVPVVATRKAGIPDLVQDRGTGLLAPPGDVKALAQCLSELLSDQELRVNLTREARKAVEAEFDIKCSAQRLLKLVEKQKSNSWKTYEDKIYTVRDT
jgi:colanic acid/amylovoran biosynthesis glycosyltransferase